MGNAKDRFGSLQSDRVLFNVRFAANDFFAREWALKIRVVVLLPRQRKSSAMSVSIHEHAPFAPHLRQSAPSESTRWDWGSTPPPSSYAAYPLVNAGMGGMAPPPPFSGGVLPLQAPASTQIFLPQGPAPELLRADACLLFFKCGKSKFYAWMNPKSKFYDPTFPLPIYLAGGRIPYWKKHELVAWVEQQAIQFSARRSLMPLGLI